MFKCTRFTITLHRNAWVTSITFRSILKHNKFVHLFESSFLAFFNGVTAFQQKLTKNGTGIMVILFKISITKIWRWVILQWGTGWVVAWSSQWRTFKFNREMFLRSGPWMSHRTSMAHPRARVTYCSRRTAMPRGNPCRTSHYWTATWTYCSLGTVRSQEWIFRDCDVSGVDQPCTGCAT